MCLWVPVSACCSSQSQFSLSLPPSQFSFQSLSFSHTLSFHFSHTLSLTFTFSPSSLHSPFSHSLSFQHPSKSTMNSHQIEKTISLMKRAYNQPILFHLLYLHLRKSLKKSNPIYHIKDDWSKLLITSCSEENLPSQGIEIKLQQFLKKLRPCSSQRIRKGELEGDSSQKLKLMVICYYLISKVPGTENHLLLYELVTNFLGISDYFDGLIITIFRRAVMCRIYGYPMNKKMLIGSVLSGTSGSEGSCGISSGNGSCGISSGTRSGNQHTIPSITSSDYIDRMLLVLKSKNLSEACRTKALLCFLSSDLKPFSLNQIDLQNDFYSYLILQHCCAYVRYSNQTKFIKEIFPGNFVFINKLKEFMNGEYEFVFINKFSYENCLIENLEIFEKVKEAFGEATDKKRFMMRMSELLMELNRREGE